MPKEPEAAQPNLVRDLCNAAITQMDGGMIKADEKARTILDFMKKVAEKSDTEVVLRFSDFSASHQFINKPWASNTFATSFSNVHKVFRSVKCDHPEINKEMMIAAIPPRKEYRDQKNPTYMVCLVDRKRKTLKGVFVSMPVAGRHDGSLKSIISRINVEHHEEDEESPPETTDNKEDEGSEAQLEIHRIMMEDILMFQELVESVVETILNTPAPIDVYASISDGRILLEILHELDRKIVGSSRDHPIKNLYIRKMSNQIIARLSKPVNLLPDKFVAKLQENLSLLKKYRFGAGGQSRKSEIYDYVRLPEYQGFVVGDYAFYSNWKVSMDGRLSSGEILERVAKDKNQLRYNLVENSIKHGD